MPNNTTLHISTVTILCAAWAMGCANDIPQMPVAYRPLLVRPSSFADSDEFTSNLVQFDNAVSRDKNDVTAYRERATFLGEAGQFADAENDFTKAIAVLEDQNSESQPLAEIYVKRGIVRWSNKKVVDAIADYSRAIELQPEMWEAYFHRWQAYRFQGKRDKARQDRKRGMSLKPTVFEQDFSFDSGVI